MNLNFPISPTDGQQYSAGDRTWVWSVANNAWDLVAVSTSDAEIASAYASLKTYFLNYRGIAVS